MDGMHYRYEAAVLTGSRFGIWLARLFGVNAKMVKMNLTPEEAKKLGIEPEPRPEVELPPGYNNGEDL